MVKDYLLIGIGGFLGAISRVYLQEKIEKELVNGKSCFPVGTFTINLLGSFLLGMLLGIVKGNENASFTQGITIGFLGAFTTFATVSFEGLKLLEGGNVTILIKYVSLSIALGVFLAYMGLKIGSQFA